MIACISPNIGNCEQTLNTLRYADRVKERHPETGQLSLNVLSSGNGSRSITPTRKQPHAIAESNSMSSSIHNQSMISQKSDLLDELLASPENSSHGKEHDEFDDDLAADTDINFEGLAPRQVNAEKLVRPSSNKRHSPSSDVLRELISTHVDSTEVMMEMIREEMSIINTNDTTANQFDDYLTRVYTLQEEQLTMIKMLRELLSQYRSMDPATATTNQNSTLNYTDHLNESDTDDAFEDLRD